MEENNQTTPPSSSQIVPIIMIVIVLAIAYFAITSKSKSEDKIAAAPEVVNQIAVNQEQLKTIDIEAGSFYYKPNVITLKKGEKVKIVLHSVSMMHDFNIDELAVKLPIVKNGDTGSVEFTASQVGTFEYYCSVGQHRKMGQVGKLAIIE